MIPPINAMILDEVGSWKVISVKKLYEVLNASICYTGFCQCIQRMEKEGLLASRYIRRKGKYLGLTEKGAAYSSSGSVVDWATFKHDLIVTETLFKLLEFEKFTAVSVGENGNLDLCPDGIIYATKKDREYLLALEVELNRKSRYRLVEKFSMYAKDSALGNILYVTNKKGLFDAYVKILSKMKREVREAIIMSWSEGLGKGNYDHKRAVYWFDGELTSFEQLFGEKNV